jgi:8-oxo-dGTP diphosphatase
VTRRAGAHAISAGRDQVDWTNWISAEEATLLYIVQRHRILFIRKKRGLGAGKLNGAGGRVEDGESPLAAARRELTEELGITALDVAKHGEVWFQVLDGTAIRIHVYAAPKYTGEPRETAEAVPVWSAVDEIPYDRMWADDRYWLPVLLKGGHFLMRALFDDDRLVSHEIDVMPKGFEWPASVRGAGA